MHARSGVAGFSRKLYFFLRRRSRFRRRLGRFCLFLRPVVVGGERVGRLHEALGRNHFRRVCALRIVDLLEHGVLGRLFRGDFVPRLQERGQDLGRRAQDLRAEFGAHLLQRIGILLLPPYPPAHVVIGHGGADRLLLLRRQALPYVGVDDQLGDHGRLVHARHVVVLVYLRQPQLQVFGGGHPLGAVDHAALCRGRDLAAGHVDRVHAHALEDLGDDARFTAFQALEVLQVLDRPLEPAEGLRAGRHAREGDHVHLECFLVEIPVHLHPAAFVHPSEEIHMVHAERPGRRGREQRRGRVLALPVVSHRVRAVEDLLVASRPAPRMAAPPVRPPWSRSSGRRR